MGKREDMLNERERERERESEWVAGGRGQRTHSATARLCEYLTFPITYHDLIWPFRPCGDLLPSALTFCETHTFCLTCNLTCCLCVCLFQLSCLPTMTLPDLPEFLLTCCDLPWPSLWPAYAVSQLLLVYGYGILSKSDLAEFFLIRVIFLLYRDLYQLILTSFLVFYGVVKSYVVLCLGFVG